MRGIVISLVVAASAGVNGCATQGTTQMAGAAAALGASGGEATVKAAGVSVGQIVGARLGQVGERDDFPFQAEAGQEYVIHLQGMNGQGLSMVQLELRNPTDNASLAQVLSMGDAPTLESSHQQSRIRALESGRHLIRVAAFRESPNWVGPYRFQVLRVNRAPELAAATITGGNAVTERIDHVGDVDEFRLDGRSGQRVVLYVQGTNGRDGRVLAEVVGPDGNAVLGTASSIGTDPSLEGQHTDAITLPASGTYTVRVQQEGMPHLTNDANGPYRIQLRIVQ